MLKAQADAQMRIPMIVTSDSGGHDAGLPVTITGITGHDRPEYPLKI
tara:strand:+ start:1761 stop:1901 length:141 start_codon:yes stop_codon:yes gene_type:complete